MPGSDLHPGEVELFRESQPFHRNRLIRYLMPIESAVVSLLVLGFAVALASKGQRGDALLLVAVWVAAGVCLPAWIFFMRMVTVVTDRRLLVRFRPFPGVSVEREEIAEAEAVRYSPLVDCGGWGIKSSRKFGRVYNVSGERGVRVVLKEGARGRPTRMLLGSDRADELAGALAAGG